MYVEFTVSQTMEHFLGCHDRAFTALGVPTKIMVDNLKSAVLRRLTGTAPVFNPRYVDYARHHSFEITACNVAAGNENAFAERFVRSIKGRMSESDDLRWAGITSARAHPVCDPLSRRAKSSGARKPVAAASRRHWRALRRSQTASATGRNAELLSSSSRLNRLLFHFWTLRARWRVFVWDL
jgi:hypothetical protein